MKSVLPSVSLSRKDAACHLYAHANGEEMLLLDLPGDGSFSIGWVSVTAADNLASRGWIRDDASGVDARLATIVAERLALRRERPSVMLARLLEEMGQPRST